MNSYLNIDFKHYNNLINEMMIKFEEEEEKTPNSVTTFKDVPLQILQAKIF